MPWDSYSYERPMLPDANIGGSQFGSAQIDLCGPRLPTTRIRISVTNPVRQRPLQTGIVTRPPSWIYP